MKNIIFLILLALFLSGCASYKFQRGKEPYNKGYVASREGYTMVEYTLGKDNSVPNLELARDRFKRRKGVVEHYYKKMGYIENRFKTAVWDPPILFLKFIGGIFRLPSIAISDYKYEHNPQYRKKIKKMQEEQDAEEEARIKELKEELYFYIEEDLSKEKAQG